MYIDRVTFTGADDSVNPAEVLSRMITLAENSGVSIEIALLLGREYIGSNRFPSQQWIDSFCEAVESMGDDFYRTTVFISGHMCGDYVQEFLNGTNVLEIEQPRLWAILARVQINTHGIPHQWNTSSLQNIISQNSHSSMNSSFKEFIFQLDSVNDSIFQLMVAKCNGGFIQNVVPLFDMSHGAGVHTKCWPPACFDVSWHGYAGGIGPENILETITDIESVTNKHTNIWIDMETKVRSDNDKVFDLGKCTAVIEQLPQFPKHGLLDEETQT